MTDAEQWTGFLATSLLFAVAFAAIAAGPLRFLIRRRVRRLMASGTASGAAIAARAEQDVSPLQLDTSAPSDEPKGDAARALFAAMRRARRRAAVSYLVAGLLAACVLAVADAVAESRPFSLAGRIGLLLNHMGAVLLTVAAIVVPSFRTRLLGLVLSFIVLTYVTIFLNDVELSFATFGLAPALFFLLVGNRWLKTIAIVAVLMALVIVCSLMFSVLVLNVDNASFVLSFLLLFLAIGTAAFFLLEHLYDRKLFSDVSIELTFLWIMFLVSWIMQREERRVTAAAAIAFLLYETVVYTGLLTVRREARAHRPVSLLVLRAFGTPSRSHGFFERLGTRWRYAGPIHLIAGTDSAIATLDPSEAVRCLTLRIPSLFVKSDADLESRLDTLDCTPDPDGRYRVNDFFCTEPMWRRTFEELLGRSDVVLVDLAGYDASNAGVTWELGELLATRPLGSFVLITDRTTNREHLELTLQRLWRQAGTNAERPVLRVLHEPKAHALVAALCDAFPHPVQSPP